MGKKKTIKKKVTKYLTKAQKKKLLLKELEKSLGIVSTACVKAGISRNTFYIYYRDDEDFKAEVDAMDDYVLDYVENKNFENIKSGDVKSIMFYLKTKGKNRGFVEKTEQTINHNINSIDIQTSSEDVDEDLEKL